MKRLLMFLTILVLFLLPFNGLASDFWSGGPEFRGWKGKGDSNPYKNISTASVIRSAPVVTEAELLKRAYIHLEEGEYKKAIKSYEQAIRANRNSAEAYKGIGLAYYKLGYNEQSSNPEVLSMAVTAFEKSLAIKQDAEAYYTLGLSYLALDDKGKAESAQLNIKPLNPLLADSLSAKITAYGAPRNYISVRNPETERIEAEEAMQRQEARRQAAARQEANEIEQLRDNYNQQNMEIQNLQSVKGQMEYQKSQLEFEKNQMQNNMQRKKRQMEAEIESVRGQMESQKSQMENEMQLEKIRMENEKRQMEADLESERMRLNAERIRHY